MGIALGIVLVWFLIEMLVWGLIAQVMSGWYVFFWFVVAAFIGISLMKQTFKTINPMAQAMKSGVIPNPATQPSEQTIAKSVALGIAGLLFLIPGLLSDVLALILLIPAVQKALVAKAKNYAMQNQAKMMDLMAKQMGGTAGFGGMAGMGGMQSPFGKGTTIDGQAKDLKKSFKAANDP